MPFPPILLNLCTNTYKNTVMVNRLLLCSPFQHFHTTQELCHWPLVHTFTHTIVLQWVTAAMQDDASPIGSISARTLQRRDLNCQALIINCSQTFRTSTKKTLLYHLSDLSSVLAELSAGTEARRTVGARSALEKERPDSASIAVVKVMEWRWSVCKWTIRLSREVSLRA